MFDRIIFLILMFAIAVGLFMASTENSFKSKLRYTTCSETLKYSQDSDCIYSNTFKRVNGNCIKVNNVIICGSYTLSEKE